MTGEKEIRQKRLSYNRTVVFSTLVTIICVPLFLKVALHEEGRSIVTGTNISQALTDSAAANQTQDLPPEKVAEEPHINEKNEFAAVRPFKSEAFLVGSERLDPTRERQSIPRVPGVSEDSEPDEEAEERRERARAEYADKAADFRNMQLKDEKGEIPFDAMEKAKERLKEMQAEQQRRAIEAGKPHGLTVAGLAPGDWVSQGPGNIGGRIRSIAIHPTNTNMMWVGSVGGGIWKTVNSGTTWFPVDDFMPNLAVSAMVIDPINPATMYAATGEGIGSGHTQRGDGIFKSTDSGVNWTRLASTRASDPAVCPVGTPCPWEYVNRLAISPDGSTILAATTDGIQRSTNGGLTWSPAGTSGEFLDVDFDPINSQLAIGSSNGLVGYTTTAGQSWTTATFSPAIGAGQRVEVAYAPSNPTIVYASVNKNEGEVYRSTDGGQTFTLINTAAKALSRQGNYANIIWVNPQDPGNIIIGGLDLWRSTDSGQTFTQISRWQSPANVSAHADHHMIVASPAFNNSTNKTVFFGNDGGIYRANDVSTVAQTSGWTNLNNSLGITQFYGGAANSAGLIIGGTQDNGNLRADPVGFSGWTDFTGGDGGYVAADPTNVNYFYTEYIHLTIQRSTNGAGSASYIYCNPVPANNGPCTTSGILDAAKGDEFANFIAPFILDPNDPNRMLAGGISLWRSNNIKAAGQPTWAEIKSPVAPRPPAPDPNPTPPISAIAVAKVNSDLVVVGHNDGQMYISQNGLSTPATWSRIDNGTPQRYVMRIAIDETHNPNWIYATYGGFSSDNIYRTEDLGVTWTDVSGSGATSLPDVPVRSIVINPVRPDYLYVGTEIGIFASEDAGATWMLPQGGPANVAVDELFYNQGKLAAATHGRGVYQVSTPGYLSPRCEQPTTTCPCAGEWNCGCNWPSGFIPDSSVNVVVSCPLSMTGASGLAKNVRVDSDLRLIGGRSLTVSENFANYGTTVSTSPTGGGFLTARNIYSGGVISFKSIDASEAITLGGNVIVEDTLEATKDITVDANTNLIAGRINTYGSFYYGSAATLSLTTDLLIAGDLFNFGKIQGRTLGYNQHYLGGFRAHTFSGPGILRFTGMGSGTGLTVPNSKTFEANNFTISGPLNIGANSVAINDNLNFTGTGAVSGAGTILINPRTGVNSAFSYFNASFTPTLKFASGTSVVTGNSNLIGGPLVVDAGATLALNFSNLTANNDVTVNGRITTTGSSSATSTFYFNGTTLTNNGEISNVAGQDFFFGLNADTVPRSQSIVGTGSWSPSFLDIGGGQGGAATVTLMNDMTFSGGSLRTGGSSTLNIGTTTLTHAGNSLSGQILGTGTIRIQPLSGATTVSGNLPSVKIVSGTATLNGGSISGPFNVDAGATATLGGNLTARGDVTIDGVLNRTGSSQYVNATGNSTVMNNGSISADMYFGPFSGTTNVVQNLGGAGTWTPTYLSFLSRSAVTLVGDVNYAGTNLVVESPGIRVNTGAFTFSFPCTTVWQNAGEIFGNIRRTNLAACPGSTITFGNPFTTIRFTSGTPPTDIKVDTSSVAPVGFPNAVRRSYQITPTGGSGYTATLRLRYLDPELNGNSESTLQLWRNNGTAWTAQGATSRDSANNWVEYAGVTAFSPWAISGLAPTAAEISISGRVTTADGSAIRNVRVSLTDQSGNVRSALTNAFGHYRFDRFEAGQTVVLSIAAKRYVFASPTRIVTVQEELVDIDFTAEP